MFLCQLHSVQEWLTRRDPTLTADDWSSFVIVSRREVKPSRPSPALTPTFVPGQKGDERIREGSVVPPSVSPVSQWPDEMNLAVKDHYASGVAEGAGSNVADPRRGQKLSPRAPKCRTFVIGVGMTRFSRPGKEKKDFFSKAVF